MIALVLVVAGCGDDDEGSEKTAGTVPKATLIEKGDALCRQTDRDRSSLSVPAAGGPLEPRRGDLGRWGAFLARESELLRAELDELGSLGKPDKGGAVLDRAVTNGRQVVELAAEASRSAKEGDLPAYKRAFERLLDPAQKASTAAHEFGFRVCG